MIILPPELYEGKAARTSQIYPIIMILLWFPAKKKVTSPIAAPLFLIVHQQAFVDFRQPLQGFNFVYQATSFIFAGICMTVSSSQLVYRHV